MSKKIRRYSVKIQEEVFDELDRIYSFIFQDSSPRARTFLRSLKRKILSLKTLPHRGRRVKLLEDKKSKGEIRFIEHQGYLIFFTIHEKEVIILHVTGPGQDWIQLFLEQT